MLTYKDCIHLTDLEEGEIEAIEALLANNSQAVTTAINNTTNTNENQTGNEKGNGQGRQGQEVLLTGSAASPPNTGGEVVSRNLQIPLGKGGAKLDATFPDAESMAAFQFQDIIDAATKGKTPEERDAARQRGVSMLAAMMEDTPLSEPELRKKLQGYRESVIEQANAANPLQVFKPAPFHAYAKTDEETVRNKETQFRHVRRHNHERARRTESRGARQRSAARNRSARLRRCQLQRIL